MKKVSRLTVSYQPGTLDLPHESVEVSEEIRKRSITELRASGKKGFIVQYQDDENVLHLTGKITYVNFDIDFLRRRKRKTLEIVYYEGSNEIVLEIGIEVRRRRLQWWVVERVKIVLEILSQPCIRS
jgi:hypothetical protein